MNLKMTIDAMNLIIDEILVDLPCEECLNLPDIERNIFTFACHDGIESYFLCTSCLSESISKIGWNHTRNLYEQIELEAMCKNSFQLEGNL